MARQLSLQTKFAYVQAVKMGESIATVSATTGISRTSLYQWIRLFDQKSKQSKRRKSLSAKTCSYLKLFAISHPEYSLEEISKTLHISKSTVWKVLRSENLSSKEARKKVQNTYYRHTKRTMDGVAYAKLFAEYAKGESITALTEKYHISRTTFYNAQKRYARYGRFGRRKVTGEAHYRYLSSGTQIVLEALAADPEASIRQIARILKRKTGQGSAYYVYGILKRFSLTTKEQRKLYAISQNDSVTRTYQLPEKIIQPKSSSHALSPQFITASLTAMLLCLMIALVTLLRLPSATIQPQISSHLAKNSTSSLMPIEKVKTEDTTQGVLAMNTSQAMYAPHTNAVLGLSVLDAKGMGVCDANVALNIISPQGSIKEYTSQSLMHSADCAPASITDKPDYSLVYPLGEPGTYQIKAVSQSGSGRKEAVSTIIVAKSLPLTIERVGATRVWPWTEYKMTIRIHATTDFTGSIVELLPKTFSVRTPSGTVVETKDTKAVRWFTHLVPGQTKEFTYIYDAEDISPALFRLGQLEVIDLEGKPVIREPHAWQLAIDGIE